MKWTLSPQILNMTAIQLEINHFLLLIFYQLRLESLHNGRPDKTQEKEKKIYLNRIQEINIERDTISNQNT